MKIQQCAYDQGDGWGTKGVAIYLTPKEAEKLLNDLDLAIGLKLKPQTVAEKLAVKLDKHLNEGE